MKSFMFVLFAGCILAAAQTSDNGANARFHARMGRDLPAVEQARGNGAQSVAHAMCCGMTECAMPERHAVSHSDADQRFHMKTGRYTSAHENPAQVDASVAPASIAHTDSEQRLHEKTGRYSNAEETRTASFASADPCALMGCCKHRS